MGEEERFASDPPILVGGGGSTLIWIRKDCTPEIIQEYDEALLKDTPKPEHPEKYRIYRCSNLEVTCSTVRSRGAHHCKHDDLPKEHLTWFD